MSKLYNNAGRSLVVDRVIELKRRRSSTAVSYIQNAISGQQTQKDLDALKDALKGITDDGSISASEKPGLKREWASLQNSYISIAEQFTSNPDLENNPAFIALRQQYVTLSELMDKILADMTTDYTGEEVRQLSDMFVNLYQQLTVCQTVLNGISDFQRNYTINITGNREVLDGSQLTAGIYRGGTEQMNPEFIDGSNYTWRRLDETESFTPRNGKSVLITSEDLPVSPCRFSCTWKDAEEQEVSLSIIFELTWGTIKEYAWSNALTVEDLQGMMPSAWYDMPPLQPSDMKYLWRRESTDKGKTWQFFRENGADGGAPQYFYKYTKTDAPDAYIGGGALFAYRNRLFAVGKTLLGAGMAGWADHVPQGPQYQDDYLWMKIVHADGTYDIIPPAQKGENAKDIRIVASIDSYQLSTRGMVLIDQEFTFALQRWYVNGTATWTVDPDPQSVPNDLEIIPQDNPDILKLKIKAGSYLESFLVSVSVEGFEATRDLRIIGINGGEESAWYFKVYPLDPNGELPVYNRETGVVTMGNSSWPPASPEGELITGDYILYKTKVIQNASDTEGHVEPIPYYFVRGEGTGDDGKWVMLDENSPYYSEAMGTMLADVVRMPDMPVTVGAMYGFFENLAAYNAFIENLFAHSIELQDKNGEIGDIHSQGYYRGAWQDPDISSGFYLGADGYAELFRVILRDARIVSESDSGDIIFSIGAVYPDTEFTHTETGSIKNFEDLIPDFYGTYDITINGVSAELTTMKASINNVGWLRFNNGPVIVPYDCTLQVLTPPWDGEYSVYVNNAEIFKFTTPSSEPIWNDFSVNSGDSINISGAGPLYVYVKSYPDSDGSIKTMSYVIENFGQGNQRIYPEGISVAGCLLANSEHSYPSRFPKCLFADYNVPSTRVTGIAYNNISFDSIAWRLPQNSNLISAMKLSFAAGMEYEALSGSTLTTKGQTYNVSSFTIQGDILSLETSSGTLNLTDDYYAKSATLNIEAQDGATIVKTLLPAAKSDTNPTRLVGSASDRFDNIYSVSGNFSGTLYANRLRSTNTPVVIYQNAGNPIAVNTYSAVDSRYIGTNLYGNHGMRVWNNRFIEISWIDQIGQDDETYIYFEEVIAEENQGGDVNLDFDTLPYVTVTPYGNYTNLSGNGNTPVLSVNRITTQGCYVTNDGVAGQFCIRIEGFLNQEAFNFLVSKYGIQT